VDEVNQNTSSTLLEADVVNLSDHDDDTDGIIDKGDGYLHPWLIRIKVSIVVYNFEV
jgi:hypothetical protein